MSLIIFTLTFSLADMETKIKLQRKNTLQFVI